MLTLLRVENFVLIDQAEIEFDKGLNVLTGETGAGKSVVIGALNLALGAKAQKDMIRKGAEKALIQAVFELSKKQCEEVNEKYDIPFDDEKLIISRTLNVTGRTSIRVNGMVVSLNVLRALSDGLVDMHGQHEHQSLLNIKKHAQLLDLYGGASLDKIKTELNEIVKEIRQMDQDIKDIAGDELEANRKLERLGFELEELSKADLSPNEDIELEEQFRTYKNLENVQVNLGRVNEIMNSESFESVSVLQGLREAIKLLGEFEDLNSDLKEFYNQADRVFYELDDLNSQIERYKEEVYFDEETYLTIETRLDLINNMKRKYGHTVEAILTYKETIENEYEQLQKAMDLYSRYQEERKVKVDAYLKVAHKLTQIRKEKAFAFEKEIKKELKALNFENAQLNVNFKEKSKNEIWKDGLDQVEYLISLNKGEEAKPLKRIASGGEMSRIMLAIKIIFARIDDIPLLVFDEVDTGISGRTAGIVGEKIAYVSQFHQVLCISHLPQIAVLADQHYLIEKQSDANKTTTFIHEIKDKERIDEVSRLLGGHDVGKKTIESAQELLTLAKKKKESLHKTSK